MMMENPYVKALEIMQERGMCKGTQEDSEGRVCVIGAYSIAVHGQSFMAMAPRLLNKVATDLFPGRGRGWAASVNNADETTQEDVELILKHCIGEWEFENHI